MISLTPLSSIKHRRTTYLWRRRLQLGLNVLAGEQGVSKSLLTLDWAARITTGRAWPNGDPCKLGSVIFLASEDQASVIRQRLLAAEGDDRRMHIQEGHLSLAKDGEQLIEVARSLRDVRMVVIDPLNNYLGDTQTGSDTAIRRVLGPIANGFAELGIAVVAVTHLTKGNQKPLYRIMNSVAVTAIARTVWLAGYDPAAVQDISGRVLISLKFNNGPKPPGISYQVIETGMGRGRQRQPKLQYTGFASEVSPETLSGTNTDREANPKRESASSWLKSVLGNGAERRVSELTKLAAEAGISHRTLQRAKRELGVNSAKRGRNWYWILPCSV